MWDFIDYKNFDNVIALKLERMGYRPSTIDYLINNGEMTVNDVNKRLELFDQFLKQIAELDLELKKKSNIKNVNIQVQKGDTFKTKEHGTILVIFVTTDMIKFVSENNHVNRLKFEEFKKLIKE